MPEFSDITHIALQRAVDLLRASKRTTVLTGAGISTPSGIPDFRSSTGGLWERYDPFEVASLSSFRYKPEKFFDWMQPLAKKMYYAQPNAAHIALANLEGSGQVDSVITQNIDSLHHRAGSKNVHEVHGSMRTLTCIRCYRQQKSDHFVEAYITDGEIPHCPECSNILKPDVVLMEEQLPVQTWLTAQEDTRFCELMMVVGSSLEVIPVAGLPMLAVDNGAHLIIVNKTRTYIDGRADVVFHGEDLVDILPALEREILGSNF